MRLDGKYDGTGRQPWPQQEQALNWLAENWNKSRVFVLRMDVGVGKSFVARSVQRACGGSIITASNELLRQYQSDYQDVNSLMGKANYPCLQKGVTCADWTTVLGQKACKGCPYVKCRDAAVNGEPTIFNPASLYYLKGGQFKRGNLTIVDEAHLLPGFLCTLTGTRLDKRRYPFTKDCINELFLTKWLDTQMSKLSKLLSVYRSSGKHKDAVDIADEYEKLSMTRQGLLENPANYAIWIEKKPVQGGIREYLNIKPIAPPKFIRDAVLGSGKIILMSGTLFDTDVHDLIGDEPFMSLELKSPIPAERRQIYYRPMSTPVNKDTPPQAITAAIESILTQHAGENAIVHVPYSMSEKLKESFTRPVLTNTKSTKSDVLAEFKSTGGVFLASGCAEGIDLKGDMCRVNIVPKILYPNLGDPLVIKRKALPDGDKWYALQALRTTIQQFGRSTRGITDFSVGYILDPTFARLVERHLKDLPQSFLEAIVWIR